MALLILIFLITNVLWYFLMEHIFLFVLGKLQSPISYDIHNQIFDIQCVFEYEYEYVQPKTCDVPTS